MLGIQLGWDAQDAVIDGGDVSQLLLLRLPVDVGLPQTIRAEVCACCEHCVFMGTEGRKEYERLDSLQ